jgi:hypothetical protein
MGNEKGASLSRAATIRATPWGRFKGGWKSATHEDAGDRGANYSRLAFSARDPIRPHGGSDFFNSNVTSEVSAATSGAILQAAIASNISMIARVKALTLAAR